MNAAYLLRYSLLCAYVASAAGRLFLEGRPTECVSVSVIRCNNPVQVKTICIKGQA
jgi:hypothetical protein